MEGCAACIESARAQQEAFETEKQKAIEYSKEHKVPVAIYQEAGEWKHCEAFSAYQQGLGPLIRDTVSPYNGATA